MGNLSGKRTQDKQELDKLEIQQAKINSKLLREQTGVRRDNARNDSGGKELRVSFTEKRSFNATSAPLCSGNSRAASPKHSQSYGDDFEHVQNIPMAQIAFSQANGSMQDANQANEKIVVEEESFSQSNQQQISLHSNQQRINVATQCANCKMLETSFSKEKVDLIKQLKQLQQQVTLLQIRLNGSEAREKFLAQQDPMTQKQTILKKDSSIQTEVQLLQQNLLEKFEAQQTSSPQPEQQPQASAQQQPQNQEKQKKKRQRHKKSEKQEPPKKQPPPENPAKQQQSAPKPQQIQPRTTPHPDLKLQLNTICRVTREQNVTLRKFVDVFCEQLRSQISGQRQQPLTTQQQKQQRSGEGKKKGQQKQQKQGEKDKTSPSQAEKKAAQQPENGQKRQSSSPKYEQPADSNKIQQNKNAQAQNQQRQAQKNKSQPPSNQEITQQQSQTPHQMKESPAQKGKTWRVAHKAGHQATLNDVTCRVTDVAGDGNCFYRAVAVALGRPQEDYKQLKKQFSEYLQAHKQQWKEWRMGNELVKKIAKEGVYATYRVLRIAAESLQRPIQLFRRQFPHENVEEFNPAGVVNSAPLRILFQGQWQGGHFMAILPKDSQQQCNSQCTEAAQPQPQKPSEKMEEEIQENSQKRQTPRQQPAPKTAGKKGNDKSNPKSQPDKRREPRPAIYHCSCNLKKPLTLGWYVRHININHAGVVPDGSSHDIEGKALITQQPQPQQERPAAEQQPAVPQQLPQQEQPVQAQQ